MNCIYSSFYHGPCVPCANDFPSTGKKNTAEREYELQTFKENIVGFVSVIHIVDSIC